MARSLQPLAVGTIVQTRDDPDRAFKLARKLGFEHVQMWSPHIEMKVVGPNQQRIVDRSGGNFDWAGAAKTTRNASAATGIPVSAVFLGFADEDWSSPTVSPSTVGFAPAACREQRKQQAKRIIEFAQTVGALGVAGHIGYFPKDPEEYTAFVECVRELVDYAGARGLRFAVETGEERAESLRRFLETVGGPNLGVNFDPANFISMAAGDPLKAVEILGSWIVSTHIKDATSPASPDGWGKEPPLGEGELNLEAYLSKLTQGGFRGPLTIEREIEEGAGYERDIRRASALVWSFLTKRKLRPPGESLVKDLQQLVGADHVITDFEKRAEFSHGVWPVERKWLLQGGLPRIGDAVVEPADVEQVAAVVRWANKHRVPIIPVGGRSGIVGGTCPEKGGILLSLSRLKDFEVDDASVTLQAGAGWVGEALEKELNLRGYTLGHFPQSMDSSMVGGWLATRAIGTFSTKYGKIDDMTVAMEIVLPTGEILRTHQGPKASTGPNLNELFLGAEGTLGIITAGWFRIAPKPECRRYRSFTLTDVHSGLEACRSLMRADVRPAVIRLYDENESHHWCERFKLPPGRCLLILGFEGDEAIVTPSIATAQKICKARGAEEHDPAIGEHWERVRYDASRLMDTPKRVGEIGDALEVAAPWSRIENVYRAMREAVRPFCHTVHAHFSHFYPTGCNVYLIFYARRANDTEAEKLYRRIVDAAMEASLREGGNTSHHHGVGIARREWMRKELGVGFEVLRKLKQALDPNDIMNPGKLGL